jgi:hypothetical protein
MAVMGKIAWADSNFRSAIPTAFATSSPAVPTAHQGEVLEFTKVFRGRELTRKERRIPCDLLSVDNLTDGGIVRGRISEIVAEPGAGKASLAAAFAASVTRCEAAAWIITSDDFDPASIAAAGVDLSRLLWVSTSRLWNKPSSASPSAISPAVGRELKERSQLSQGAQAGTPASLAERPASRASRFSVASASLKAAEWILAVGGFGLVILDFGRSMPPLPQSAALRLARAAERSGAGLLVLAPHQMCGTFAALSLTLRREKPCFSRLWPNGPALFDGFRLEACVTRNKLGRSGRTAKWKTVIEGSSAGQDRVGRLSGFDGGAFANRNAGNFTDPPAGSIGPPPGWRTALQANIANF